MPRSQTTRSPNGITNAAPWQTMADAGIEDPTWAYVNHHEFDRFAAADWTTTLVGTGTVAGAAGLNGRITLTTTAGIADAVYLQHAYASQQFTPGKEHFFKCLGQLSDVVNDVFYAGLIATSATPLAAADGVYLLKAAGQSNMTLQSVIGGVTTSLAIPGSTITAATDFECGFHITANGDIEAFFNPTTGPNTPVGSVTGRGPNTVLHAPSLTQVLMNLSVGLLNSTAVARSATIDYLTSVSHR